MTEASIPTHASHASCLSLRRDDNAAGSGPEDGSARVFAKLSMGFLMDLAAVPVIFRERPGGVSIEGFQAPRRVVAFEAPADGEVLTSARFNN